MADDAIRAAERRWLSSGTDADRLVYLRSLVRGGRASAFDKRMLEVLERKSRFTEAEQRRSARRTEIERMGKGWVGEEPDTSLYSKTGITGSWGDVEKALESARRDDARVWVVVGDRRDRYDDELGHRTAGTPWERSGGYVGRSAGRQPVWILVPNDRSDGGPAISPDSVLEIASTNRRRVYWRHPSYDPSLWVWEPATNFKVDPWDKFEMERIVYLAVELRISAKDLRPTPGDQRLQSLWLTYSLPRSGSIRGLIATLLENHVPEAQIREMIEVAARKKYDDPRNTKAAKRLRASLTWSRAAEITRREAEGRQCSCEDPDQNFDTTCPVHGDEHE